MTPFFRKAISLFLFSAACAFSPRASAQMYDTTNRLSHVRNDTLMWSLADPFAFQTTSNLISRTDALSNGVAAANAQIEAGVDSLIAETDRARLAEAALAAYTNRADTALQAGATNAVYAHYGPRVSALEALANAAAAALQPAATNAVYAFYDPLILALAGYTNTAATALQAGATNAVYAYYSPRISALAAYTNKADTALQPASTNGWNTLPFLDWVLRSEVVGLVASAVEDQLSADLDQLPGFSNTVYAAVLPKLGERWHTNAPATPAAYFTYETNGLSEIVITGYAPPRAEKRVEIPARIDGRPVTGVGYAAFSANGGRIESLTLPETLRDIGAQAFPNMTSLNSRLVIPASVTNVGDNAFAYLPAAMGDRMVLFDGDMPDFGTGGGASPFMGGTEVTILRRSGTSGWGSFYSNSISLLATIGPAEAVVLNGTTNLVSGGIVDLGNNVELKSTQAGPRLDLVESETNKWRAAYGWGDHAAAGYLTSFAESDPLFAAWAATNRVTRWQDAADASVWWESNGGTNITAYRVGLSGTNFIHHVDNFTAYFLGTFDVPFPTTAGGPGYTFYSYFEDGKCLARTDTDFQTIEYVSSSTEFPQTLISTVTDPEAFTQTVSIVSYVYTTNVLASYNLTTGNVWQAVAEARQSAEQAADQIAGHLSDAAPHPGLFATASEVSGLKLGATNITDGVTSGTYSEDTRTFDISPICSRQCIRAWMPLTTHSQYGYADLAGTAGSTVALGPAPLNSFVIRVAIPTAYNANDFTFSNIVFYAGSAGTPPDSQGFNCVTTGVFSVSNWGLQSPIGFLMRRNDGIINFGLSRRDVMAYSLGMQAENVRLICWWSPATPAELAAGTNIFYYGDDAQ